MKPVKAWALVDSKGKLVRTTLGVRGRLGPITRAVIESQKYQIVRVEIRELKLRKRKGVTK